MSGTLYIVATPIGNLEDITLRAVRILSEADVILAEDTRVSKRLLDFISSLNLPAGKSFALDDTGGQPATNHQQLISYHQHSGEQRKLQILKLLMDGKNISLVTDAGTPGISDPGNELVDFVLEQSDKIRIIPIPGASAITTALSVSGFNVNKFVFLGFLPKKKRTKLFAWLKEGEISFAFYESPFRIIKTLEILKEEFGEGRQVFVARELTKIYETLYRGSITEVLEKIQKEKVKGELVVIVD